jgi:hypothetical protein
MNYINRNHFNAKLFLSQMENIKYLPLTRLELNLINSNIELRDFYERLEPHDYTNVK